MTRAASAPETGVGKYVDTSNTEKDVAQSSRAAPTVSKQSCVNAQPSNMSMVPLEYIF